MSILDLFRQRPPPRFRSAERDSATDAARIEKVLGAVAEVIAAIDGEAAGVERRLREAQMRASGLFGNEACSDEIRGTREEQMLVEAERRLVGALRRMDDLKDQRRRYVILLGQISATTQRQAPAATEVNAVGA